TGNDGIERQGLNVVASQVVPMGQIGRRAPQRSRDMVSRGGFGPQRTPSPVFSPQTPPPAAAPPRTSVPDDDDQPPW
ncbi:MAG: hypothetical protein NTZ05_02440, partial [Chloroflexi bacterium]|nr:hypothetical protein [Chloroflexota bacterium]